jgi:predicted regulator of Ras-like GTPase activity (Roadblock/LC7/MglB family)
MNAEILDRVLEHLLAEFDGIRSCALVESDSGLVWQVRGELADRESLWESSANYWNQHRRNASHFDCLGQLGAAVMYHADRTLAMIPFLPQQQLLLVCVAEPGRVDWTRWQLRARDMARHLQSARRDTSAQSS